jgi:hypothetical protein
MENETVTQKAKALTIGMIGGMYVQVGRNDIPEWPEGAVALSLGGGPFVIFSTEVQWIRNPNGHDKRDKIVVGSPLYGDWKRHMQDQLKVIKTPIHNPMNCYFMISHLFLDGYSLVRHINWASYLTDKVAEMLQKPHIINELLINKNYSNGVEEYHVHD